MANFYTPDTAVYLANTPLNVNKKDTFAPNNWTAAAQLQYFQGCIPSPTSRYTFTDFTYQRKDGVIRVPINVEVLYAAGINYCFYRNTHYNGKWFYCFITKMEFLNENTTALYIKTDVFQTWYFDMDIKYSFVERETVLHDDIFKHTLAEPLPTPEMICLDETRLTPNIDAQSENEFANHYWCCVFMSEKINETWADIPRLDSFVGGVPCPCYIYATDLSHYYDLIDAINEDGKADAVVSCVAIPKSMVTYHSIHTPVPPSPPDPPFIAENYKGSPYSTNFRVSSEGIFDPPNHEGQDLVCDENDGNANVYSTVDGVVEDARWHNDNDHSVGYGLLVRIRSTVSGYEGAHFIFGHLSSIAAGITVGAIVQRGDFIGVQGNTGYCVPSTFKHVHYQVCGANGDGWHTDLINPSSLPWAQYPNEGGSY